MNNIEFKFAIGDWVKIKELNCKGRVLSLWTGRRGNEIQVRYSTDTEYKEVYFFEDELELV